MKKNSNLKVAEEARASMNRKLRNEASPSRKSDRSRSSKHRRNTSKSMSKGQFSINMDHSVDFVETSSEEGLASKAQTDEIFEAMAQRGSQSKRHLEEDDVDADSEMKRDRELDVQRKIEKWRNTNEYKRLGERARAMVEKSMLEKEQDYSSTYIFLTML